MAEGLLDLWDVARAAVASGESAVKQQDLATARECARVLLSVGSKLHQKLGILVDMSSDASWRAEVDRALTRAAKTPRPELPGQQTIADENAGVAATRPSAKEQLASRKAAVKRSRRGE